MTYLRSVLQPSQPLPGESSFRRYGMAVLLACLAAGLAQMRPVLMETPHFLFLGAVVLSAMYGGLGPAFITTLFSSMLIRVLFVQPHFTLISNSSAEDLERMGLFVLTALMTSSLTAALRRDLGLLRESEERYRVLAETASDAMLVVDERGIIRFVNPGAERLFGAAAHHLIGRTFSSLLPEDLAPPQWKDLKSRFELQKRPVAVELPARLVNGQKILLEMTYGAFTRHGKELIGAIIRDVTSRPPGHRMAAAWF